MAAAEADGGQDDDRGHHVGQDVAEHDAQVPGAHGARRLHVRVLHHAMVRRRGSPASWRRRSGATAPGSRLSSPGPEHGHEREDDDQVRERHARRRRRAGRRCRRRRRSSALETPTAVASRVASAIVDEAHRDRDARAVHDAAPHVAARGCRCPSRTGRPAPSCARRGCSRRSCRGRSTARTRAMTSMASTRKPAEGAERLASAEAQQSARRTAAAVGRPGPTSVEPVAPTGRPSTGCVGHR